MRTLSNSLAKVKHVHVRVKNILSQKNDPIHIADHLMDNSVGIFKFLESNHTFSPT